MIIASIKIAGLNYVISVMATLYQPQIIDLMIRMQQWNPKDA